MAMAWDDDKKILHERVELHEPIDGVIVPKDPTFGPMLLISRRLNPGALLDLSFLRRDGVPQKYWAQDGNGLREMTPAEKAVQDAKPPPVPPPDPPDPT